MSLRSLLLCAAFGVTAGAASAGQMNGWYVGLEGGANWVEDWSHILAPAGPAENSFDTGWAVFVTTGYKWTNNIRVEFEAGYRDNEIDSVAVTGVVNPALGGDVWQATAMANVLYDIDLMDKLSLSLGAGAGGDFANSTFSTGVASAEDDGWNFAYQGIAGLNYMIGQRTAVTLNYRYLRAVDPGDYVFLPTITAGQFNGDDFVKHTATIGLRYALQPSAAPYVPPPPPPPPSGPISAPRQFIVFFGFNKYVLTSEALRVISEAVAAAKETGSASVLITGHTDTVGSNSYNQHLSMRRSNAVKGEMVRQGIAPAAIITTGKGETELLVQTADGVKEPQNRRATIDLN